MSKVQCKIRENLLNHNKRPSNSYERLTRYLTVFVFVPLWTEFQAVVDQGLGVYSQNFKTYTRTSVFFAGRFTLSQSTSPVRSAKYLRTFFLEFVCLSSRDFVNQHVFLLLDLHWDSSKLPWGIQRICGPFCFEDYHYAFQQTLCPVTLAHYRSLYFMQVYIFIPLINSAPFFRAFHTSYFTSIFFLCMLPREIFFLSLLTLLLGI